MSSSAVPSVGVSMLLPFDKTPSFSYKERTRRLLHLASYKSGFSSLYARLQQESVATILMYHSVPTLDESRWIDPYNSLCARDFNRQMRFLARHRHVISIGQLVQRLEQGKPLERGTVAITFDDGYRNNLTVAAPILAKYNLPATIYLATGYVESGRNQWSDNLYAAFRARSNSQLLLAEWDSTFHDWDLANSKQRNQAHSALAMYLIQADLTTREALLTEIDKQLAPVAYPPRLTLNWEEAKTLKTQYPNITLGVHTSNHLDLSTHCHKTKEEMTTSIQQMMSGLGTKPKHFAFPYNRYCDKAQAQVKAAQLRSAVIANNDPVVRKNTAPHALPRLEAPRSMAILKSWTNGGFPDVSRRLFKQPWIRPY
ncbi:MAG: polysaccharide deacetylase family protein [Phormidesmis sp.]